jgi:hypothetical protein
MLLTAVLDDGRVDAAEVQQVSEHQAGGSGADDAYLSTVSGNGILRAS